MKKSLLATSRQDLLQLDGISWKISIRIDYLGVQ